MVKLSSLRNHFIRPFTVAGLSIYLSDHAIFFYPFNKSLCVTPLTYNKRNTRNFPTLILSNKLNVTAKQQISNSLRKPIYLSQHFPDIRSVLQRQPYGIKYIKPNNNLSETNTILYCVNTVTMCTQTTHK